MNSRGMPRQYALGRHIMAAMNGSDQDDASFRPSLRPPAMAYVELERI